MNVIELRIGDKVKYLDKIFTIRMLCDGGYADLIIPDKSHSEIEYGVDVKDVQPIPLTDELLKNIGFNSNNAGEYIKTIGTVCLSIVKLSKCYYLVFVDYDKGNDLLDKPIKYLHQLQHELYDAGIELKIEL